MNKLPTLVATLFPRCWVAPIKFISKVDKSTDDFGGRDTIIFCPLDAVVCPDNGTILKFVLKHLEFV